MPGHPVVLFLIVMALAMAARAPLLNIPFDRDEGGYAYIGWRMSLHEIPYRDWVDLTPPGIFWVYRMALALPLEPLRAVHLVAALFAGASAGILFLIGRRFLKTTWAFVAGVLLGFCQRGQRSRAVRPAPNFSCSCRSSCLCWQCSARHPAALIGANT